MRRLIPLLLAVVLLLGECASELEPVTKVVDGQEFTIQFESRSSASGTAIAENGDIYRFEPAMASSSNWVYALTYPDGSNGLDEAANRENGYVDANALAAAIADAKPLTFVDIPFPLFIIGLVVAGLGIWQIADPEFGWLFRYHRYVSSYTELSSRQLWIRRIIGILFLALGVIIIIIGIAAILR